MYALVETAAVILIDEPRPEVVLQRDAKVAISADLRKNYNSLTMEREKLVVARRKAEGVRFCAARRPTIVLVQRERRIILDRR